MASFSQLIRKHLQSLSLHEDTHLPTHFPFTQDTHLPIHSIHARHPPPHPLYSRKTPTSPPIPFTQDTHLPNHSIHARPPRWPSGKASTSRAEDPGSNPACAEIFPGSSHTSDLIIGTPVATLPGAWHYRVSTGIGGPGVSILWPGEMESLVCNFCLSVAAHTLVWADPSLRYTCMLLGR